MYHSITFGEKNTWDDWHLVPTSRPLFNPPGVKTNMVDVPGINGSVDLTEALTGEALYDDRTGSLEFIVANDYLPWEKAYSNIMNYLHGQRMHAVLEDDPGFYYDGRFSVNQWKSDKAYSLIVINYTVSPFKKRSASSLDPWLWDPFNFRTGIITNFSSISINGTTSIRVVYEEPKKTIPTFIASSPMTLRWNGQTFDIPSGGYTNGAIKIVKGTNLFEFTGNGTLSIEYRGESL